MKKGIITFGICIALIIMSLIIPSIIVAVLPSASVTKLKEVDYVGYVTATGEVQQKNKQQVTSEFPLIVSEVLVKPGDSVKVGQPVIKINREQTAQKIMENNNYVAVSGLTTGVYATSYDDAMKKLPTEVVSNIDGVIQTVSVTQGQFIDKNACIASMLGDGDLVVFAQVPENKAMAVTVGQPVEITGSGFEGEKFYGHIQEISSSARKIYVGANQETVVDITVSIDNINEKIKEGYSIKARVITEQEKQINVIPYESVLQDKGGKEYVFVFSNGFAVRKDISTGLELADGVQVVSGLNPDDLIISTPNAIKKSGTLIKINQ